MEWSEADFDETTASPPEKRPKRPYRAGVSAMNLRLSQNGRFLYACLEILFLQFLKPLTGRKSNTCVSRRISSLIFSLMCSLISVPLL
ncbi:hypothetical protein L596_029721 [Steinernema carpocapsae]|uniref:Uncharacterized protein n=1 Tax=Steinernema carpocapsae TaxID=34508 RepID=A0A4U5LQK2_STECR|nr:hypothetical protein L596_029721 [Steinernema carpocapsae]